MEKPSKEQFKMGAKYLRQVLLEKQKIDLSHGHALEVIAKALGFADWNTASALSPSPEIGQKEPAEKVMSSAAERGPAFKLLTAGEFVDFFSTLPRDMKVAVHEYEERDLKHFGTITSVCSLVYDYEIQNGTELRLELNTEEERNLQLADFGKSSNQSFEPTPAGRYQRVVKWLRMKSSFWSYSKPSDYIK